MPLELAAKRRVSVAPPPRVPQQQKIGIDAGSRVKADIFLPLAVHI